MVFDQKSLKVGLVREKNKYGVLIGFTQRDKYQHGSLQRLLTCWYFVLCLCVGYHHDTDFWER